MDDWVIRRENGPGYRILRPLGRLRHDTRLVEGGSQDKGAALILDLEPVEIDQHPAGIEQILGHGAPKTGWVATVAACGLRRTVVAHSSACYGKRYQHCPARILDR